MLLLRSTHLSVESDIEVHNCLHVAEALATEGLRLPVLTADIVDEQGHRQLLAQALEHRAARRHVEAIQRGNDGGRTVRVKCREVCFQRLQARLRTRDDDEVEAWGGE